MKNTFKRLEFEVLLVGEKVLFPERIHVGKFVGIIVDFIDTIIVDSVDGV